MGPNQSREISKESPDLEETQRRRSPRIRPFGGESEVIRSGELKKFKPETDRPSAASQPNQNNFYTFNNIINVLNDNLLVCNSAYYEYNKNK